MQTDMFYHKYFVIYKMFKYVNSDKTLYSYESLNFGFMKTIISISFYTPSGNCLMAFDLTVVLNSVSGVKYHLLFDFQ